MIEMDDNHIYTVDGKVYPSVTQILGYFGLSNINKVPQNVLDRASKFGSAVHKLLELWDDENLGKYDKKLEGYLQGWKQFKKSAKLDNLIVDIKTGIYNPSHVWQMAGYQILVEENYDSLHGKDWIEHKLASKSWEFAGTPDRVYSPSRQTNATIVYLDGKGYKTMRLYSNQKAKAEFKAFLITLKVQKSINKNLIETITQGDRNG